MVKFLKWAQRCGSLCAVIITVWISLQPEPIRSILKNMITDDSTIIETPHRHLLALWIFLCLGYLLSVGLTWFREKKYEDLEKEKLALQHDCESLRDILTTIGGVGLEGIWAIFLEMWFKAHVLSNNDRISLYCLDRDEGTERFIMLARVSPNPELKKPGRGVYNAGEGVIWKGWTQGSYCVNELPSYETDKTAYLDEMSAKGGIPKATLKSLKMKPCSIGAFAIRGTNPAGNKAVVVIESDSPLKIDYDMLEEMKNSNEAQYIHNIMVRFSENLPKVNNLKTRGF